MKYITFVLFFTFLLMTRISTGAVHSWPAHDEWEPLLYDGLYYYDEVHDAFNAGADDNHIDIVGDTTNYPAAFTLSRTEGTEDQLLFRIRVDGYKKTNKTVAWLAYLETDNIGGFDYCVELTAQLNNNQTNQWFVSPVVRLTAVESNGTSTDIQLAATNLWTSPTGETYAKWVSPADSSMGGTPDAFVDFAVPATILRTAAGLAPNEPIAVVVASSKTPGVIDGGDLGIHTGSIGATPVDLTLYTPDEEGYISGISPASAGQLGGTQITISGTHLGDETAKDILAVTLNGIPVTSIDSVSATQIVVTAAASGTTGTGTIVVTTASGESITTDIEFTYLYEVAFRSLNILPSDHGTPDPAVGSYSFEDGIVTNLSVTSPVEIGSTQYVCSGWAMTGDTVAVGKESSVFLTMTNDVTFGWLWTTNYLVEAVSEGNGTTVSPGWVAAGQTIEVIPHADPYHDFAGWSGDATGTDNPLSIQINGPMSISAAYKASVTANTGTPLWWLAQIDTAYTNDFEAAAISNPDGDSFANWKEYVADFNPYVVDVAQSLEIADSEIGQLLSWTGSTNRQYRILWGTDLEGGAITNVLVENHIPATSGLVTYTNSLPMDYDTVYYRLVVSLKED